MKAEALFRMPLYVVVALWLLRRRAALRAAKTRIVKVEAVDFGEELAIFEQTEAFAANTGATWLDRALLWLVSGRRKDAARLAKFNWIVVGMIPRGDKVDDHN